MDTNITCHIISFDLWQPAIESLKPHLVTLNHLHGKRNQTIADTVRRRGGLAVVLPSEGRPNTNSQIEWATQQWPTRLCDLYLAWSDAFAALLSRNVNIDEANVKVVGCPRFDLYHKSYDRLRQSREHIAGLYSLDSSKPIITVASSFPNAKFLSHEKFLLQDWADLGVSDITTRRDPMALVHKDASDFELFRNWIHTLALEHSEWQFIVKPHPAEDIRPWQRTLYELPNARLMLIGFMHDLLAASDCHVAKHDCVTVPEAWLANVPVIAAFFGLEDDGPAADCLQIIEGHETYSSLEAGVLDVLENTSPNPPEAIEYAHKWLGEPLAASKVALAISDLLKSRTPKTHSDPTPQDEIQLHLQITQHARNHFYPQQDAIGQYGKAVTQQAVEEWRNKVTQ